MANKKNSSNEKSKKNKTAVVSKRSKVSTSNSFDSDIWNKMIIVCVIIIFLALFYLLTLYITSKNSSDSTSGKSTTNVSDDASISYDEILVGRSFSIDSGEYLVIYYDKSDDNISSDYSELVSNYSAKDDHLNIYTVDMSNGLNKKYASDDSNDEPTKASELAISGPTLIRFTDGEVAEYLEGLDDISDYLQ